MIDLKVPDPEGAEGIQPSREAQDVAPQAVSAAEREAQLIMSVDLTDHASRMRARRAVDALGKDGLSATKSRLLDRRILALAQAGSDNPRISSELQRLAVKARELSSEAGPRRRGFFRALFGPAETSSERYTATIRELEGIVSSLVGSAEVLRQNSVALDGYEADISEESQQVMANIAWAGDLHEALAAAIERAKEEGSAPDNVRFATHEVLFPLEEHRYYLQNLLAVNQQAAASLAILRDTNAMLIAHVQQITLATRSSLDIAVTLRRFSPQQQHGSGRPETLSTAGNVTNGIQDPSEVVEALQGSLDELFTILERHDAWRRAVAGETRDAVAELESLSAELLEPRD